MSDAEYRERLRTLLDYLEGFIYGKEKPSPKMVECYLKALRMIVETGDGDDWEDELDRMVSRLAGLGDSGGVGGDSRLTAIRSGR